MSKRAYQTEAICGMASAANDRELGILYHFALGLTGGRIISTEREGAGRETTVDPLLGSINRLLQRASEEQLNNVYNFLLHLIS